MAGRPLRRARMNSAISTTNVARIDIDSTTRRIDKNLGDAEVTVPALMRLAVEQFLRLHEGTLTPRDEAKIRDAEIRVIKALGGFSDE